MSAGHPQPRRRSLNVRTNCCSVLHQRPEEIEIPTNFDNDELEWKDCAFFFLFCPNNSGSTILSQYIASQLGAYLPPFGNDEGQMAPTVKSVMRLRPWDKTRQFDWAFVRRSWEKLAKGRLFVEASPPNIIRCEQIAAVFGKDSSACVSICNPYQQIASALRRYRTPGTDVAHIAANWMTKGTAIQSIRHNFPFFPFFTYEDFVLRPTLVNELLAIECRPFTGTGKRDSGARGVQDLSVRTISFLEPNEVDAINGVLMSNSALLEYFNYPILDGQALHASLKSASRPEYDIGRARREAWNAVT